MSLLESMIKGLKHRIILLNRKGNLTFNRMIFGRKLLLEYTKYRNRYAGFLNVGRYRSLRRPANPLHNDESVSYPLTKYEALAFLEDKLEIPNPETLVKEDRKVFLNIIMEKMRYKIPFTIIPSLTSAGLKSVSMSRFKEDVMKMHGGGCVALNSFLKAVLEHLNFKTSGILGSVYQWGSHTFDNHAALVVHDVTHSGSKHFVDVGSPSYFLCPVDLDFIRVSPTYLIRNIPYKFFNASPGVVHICTKVKPPKSGTARLIYYEDNDCWEVLYVVRTQNYCDDSVRQFTEMLKTSLNDPHIRSKIVEYFLLLGYPNKLMVNITQYQCTTFTEEGHKEVSRIKSEDHLVETVMKYFTQYTEEDIHNAAKHYFTGEGGTTAIKPDL